MKGRKFTDLTSGRIVEVKDQFENIAILDNNSKIKVDRLLDKNYFDEYIDPKSFFKNESLLNTFADKIRQLPNEVVNSIKDDSSPVANVNLNNLSGSTSVKPVFDEPAVLPYDPEAEREELMRKYGVKMDSSTEAQKQLEKFQSILSDTPTEPSQQASNDVQRIEINRDEIPSAETPNPKKESKVEDPIITMFKNVKRVKDFKITLDVENKIPRPDFIEMMEDSYNVSIIDFLADEFTNNLLSNPNIIKDKIKGEIKRLVYGNEETNDGSTTELTEVNSQITDAVTQEKPKSTRKPKLNTTQSEKSSSSKATRSKKETTK